MKTCFSGNNCLFFELRFSAYPPYSVEQVDFTISNKKPPRDDQTEGTIIVGGMAAAGVPTMSEWGLVLFTVLFAGLGIITLRRSRA